MMPQLQFKDAFWASQSAGITSVSHRARLAIEHFEDCSH
ncbi:PSTPIP1 isoform 4 [Pan troglodytes]|uniref:Proline-serine-threonine phosphatase interacting protein 1 n=2 Tax=Homininae TaxID=207598 RepID=H0YNR2_HUMAN|nr:PSTPIP1 isoform 4 [Pan troglodytes]